MGSTRTIGVIGGGLSGLAAAVLLSRSGLRVRLFEANEKLGGCCATTRIAGYTFNDGALYVALPGILDRAFDRLGLDRRATVALRPIVANQATRLPDGTVVSIGRGRDVRIQGEDGEARTAKLAREIDGFMDRWQPVLRTFAGELLDEPFSLARALRKTWRHAWKLRGTLACELDRRFSDPAARAAMAGTLLYTGTPPQKAPVLQVLGLVTMLDEGLYLPEGGMGAIPDALSAALRGHGGETCTGAPVERIRVANGRVSALEVRGHGTVPVDAAISTVSGMLTSGSLLAAQDVPAAMRRKANGAPLSMKALGIQLGLANVLDAPAHSISVLPMMEEQYRLFQPGGGEPRWLNYTVPTVTMPELAPAGGSIVEMFPPIDQSWPVERWTEEATEAVAGPAIAALSRMHGMEIAVRRVLGPREHRDRMHLFAGAVYGLSPAAGPAAQFPHRTPVAGLFQAGQTTYPGFGVGSATLSGIFAAEALMREISA